MPSVILSWWRIESVKDASSAAFSLTPEPACKRSGGRVRTLPRQLRPAHHVHPGNFKRACCGLPASQVFSAKRGANCSAHGFRLHSGRMPSSGFISTCAASSGSPADGGFP